MPDTMHFASATTTETSPLKALPSLVASIREQVPHGDMDFALLFLSPHFAEQAEPYARAIRNELGPSVLIGCTGEGVIGSTEEIEQSPAMSLVVARLPNVTLTPLVLSAADLQHSLGEARPAVDETALPNSTRLVLMVADPFTTPMDHLLDSLNLLFPGIPIIGGMASGALVPGKSALLLNETVMHDGAIAVAFGGQVAVDVIVSQGCRPVGQILKVTSVRDNVIRNLEGRTPLDHLQDLVSELSSDDRELLRNGLFVGRAIDSHKERLGRGDFLIRGVMGIDQESGAITVGDLIEEGEVIQFHLRDAQTAKEDLEMMLTPQSLFGQPSGAFLFSCNGRGTRLYDHANGDISSIQEFFPGVKLAGFFCAGEIGPIGGKNFLHGHTASLALIRPQAATLPE